MIAVGIAAIMHGGITHSLLFAVLAAGVGAIFLKLGPTFWKTFAIYAILILSHDIVDLATSHYGIGFQRGSGVQLFYPLSYEKYSLPFSLFLGKRILCRRNSPANWGRFSPAASRC